MAIKIATHKELTALMKVPYHSKMVALSIWIFYRYSKPIITSAYRENKVHENDTGIHMLIPCRAIDWTFGPLANMEKIENDINNYWEYDPQRPQMKCAICHDIGLGGHIHTQVHPDTVYHKDGRFNSIGGKKS